MKVSLIQSDLAWQDPAKNMDRLGKLLDDAGPSHLYVLPEMFSTGFMMEPEKFAEEAGGAAFKWMQEMAKKKNAVITGSIAVKDNSYFNRLYWVRPDGSSEMYDKRHLFRLGKEQDHYTPGKKRLVVKAGEWKVCPLVCYDLRFPVWSRCGHSKKNSETPAYEYDLLIYVANWPAVRGYAWRQLLIARAIENQCYVIGVNRTGTDGNNLEYAGDSMAVGPLGEVLLHLDNEPRAASVTLDMPALTDFRQRFPAGMDADDFEIRF